MKRILRYPAVLLSLFNVTLFFAMRPCWSGISKTLGYGSGGMQLVLDLPVYLCGLLALIALSCITFAVRGRGSRWPVVYTAVGVVFLAAVTAVVVLGAKDYMRFIWPNFLEAAAVEAAAALAWWLVYAYPKGKLRYSRVFRAVVLIAVVACTVLFLTRFGIHRIAYEPVVYAVEDEYQIVFSGSTRCTGWVTVDGTDYYDLYNGSMTDGRVHKVHVPMYALDSAKGYEIHLQQVIYRGPFGGILGKELHKSYSFRPVDSSDGLTYLAFSDIHMHKDAAAATAAKAGAYDFLVMNGDIVSMTDRFRDANYCNEVSFAITGGEIPVVYARGNHEVKGGYAPELHKYVGSKDGGFYYNFYFDDVYGTVLDLGEDHDDDWWEYYGMAHYEDYRSEQAEFLAHQIGDGNYRQYNYRLAVCHIPITFVNSRKNHVEIKEELTSLLNEMGTDMLLCGHQHEVLIFDPGAVEPHTQLTYNPAYKTGTYKGYLTDFRFPSLMVSKPGFTQTDSDEASHIGLLVSVTTDGMQECRYLNSRGETVPVVNPFAEIDYGDTLRFPLNHEKAVKEEPLKCGGSIREK